MQENVLELKISTGKITVPIIESGDGEVIGKFSFNPNDLDLVRRYEEVAEYLNNVKIPENAGAESFLAFSDEIKKQLDYLLNYNVSDEIFSKCNPLSLTENGDFYIENVLKGIAGIIEKTTNQRIEKKLNKIKKAVAEIKK